MDICSPAQRLIPPGYLLPQPMPGETIPCFSGRFHRAAPLAPANEMLTELFGPTTRWRLNCRVPARISELSSRVGAQHPFGDTRYVMEMHTMVPYYCYFHTPGQREHAYSKLLGDKGAVATYALIKNAANYAVDVREWPAFCPHCTQEDLRVYRFSYWRVVHQLPAVMVCPWHQCVLREVRRSDDSKYRRPNLWPPDLEGPAFDSYPQVEHPALDKAHLVRLAQASLYVQERPAGFPGDWRKSMMALLREMGFSTGGGFAYDKIAQRVTDVHGQALLEWLGVAEPGAPVNPIVLRRTLHLQRARSATIVYLVFALAIRPDLATLEKDMAELLASPKQKQHDFLPPWADTLRQEWEQGVRIKELAARHHCTQANVRRYLIRLGKSVSRKLKPLDPKDAPAFYAAARKGKTTTELGKQFRISTDAIPLLLEKDWEARRMVAYSDFMRSRDTFRARVMRMLAKHPTMSADTMASKLSYVYLYMYRYDSEWCRKHFPKPAMREGWKGGGKRSAGEIDRELATRVAKTIRLLVDLDGVKHLDMWDVLAKCRALTVYGHYQGRLPLTDTALKALPSFANP